MLDSYGWKYQFDVTNTHSLEHDIGESAVSSMQTRRRCDYLGSGSIPGRLTGRIAAYGS